MRAGVVALCEPVIDDDLVLLSRRKRFGIENFPAQCAIEPFVVSVLPGRSRIDADRLDANASKPVLQCFGGEIGSVYLIGCTLANRASGEVDRALRKLGGAHLRADCHRQRLPCELV
jgi:hypothetical protein